MDYENNNKWIEIKREVLTDNYIDLSLSPGSYRYKVLVVNLLDQKEGESDFRYFIIRKAYQPNVNMISPKAIYFDEEYRDEIILTGNNFHEDTEFFLQHENGHLIKGEVIEHNKTYTKIKVKYNMISISPSVYKFLAVDPSGLSDASKDIRLAFQKPVDTYLSGSYLFSGFVGNDIFKRYFNGDFAPVGGYFKA